MIMPLLCSVARIAAPSLGRACLEIAAKTAVATLATVAVNEAVRAAREARESRRRELPQPSAHAYNGYNY